VDYLISVPVPLAAPSKARVDLDLSNAGIVSSNPALGMGVLSAFFCVVLSFVSRGLGNSTIPRPRILIVFVKGFICGTGV
jgi:hypothetical protein